MILIPFLWSCFGFAVVVGAPETVIGHRGERVDIKCPYDSGYEANTKYFCKDECPVLNKNIMVRSGFPAKDERFSLTDDTTARVFTVTITDLRTEDKGRYWCAVKRTLLTTDVYSEIYLQVKLAPLPETPFPQTTSANRGSLGLIIAGVLFLLLIGAVTLIVVIRKKKQACGLASSFTAGSHPTVRKGEENEYDKGNRTVLPNSHTAQSATSSAANKLHKPANTEAGGADLDYINVSAAMTNRLTPDHIYTKLNDSRESHIYHCLTAAPGKAIHRSIDQPTQNKTPNL
ncbi:protein CD300H-like [Pseudorasbora parva]|uniref:protein CD300H-like n=1 Tax=Pseudorasbora parva TaxID=51549 RepID=UPI00351E61CD